jgi:platelet-activating factor acetylhydrolase
MTLSHALALDPWLEALPLPGPIPYSHPSATTSTISTSKSTAVHFENGPSQPELLVIDSEGFTLWNDHFTRLKSIVKEWAPGGRRLLTLGPPPYLLGVR